MIFDLQRQRADPELRAWRARCRAFVETEILPNLAAWERSRIVVREYYRRLGAFGYLRLSYPRRLGGLEVPPLWEEAAMEELARAGLGPRSYLVLGARNYGWLLDDGVPEHEARLREVLAGQTMLAFAATEAAGGSDAANIRTAAVREADGYRLTGTKAYISFVPGADFIIVTALTDPSAGGKRGMSLFLVPADAPGVTTVPVETPDAGPWHVLGTVVLRDVRVPASALLGEEHRGFYLIKANAWSRRGLDHRLTPGEALARYFLEPLDVARRRRAGGRRLVDAPQCRARLVESFGLVELYRLAQLSLMGAAGGAGPAGSAGASAMQLFLKVFERRMMLGRLAIEGAAGASETNRVLRETVFQAGMRAAGGGVDVHRIVLGEALFGRDWASHRP